METTSRLTRRVEALEQAVRITEGLPCLTCGRLHIYEAMSLERLGARFEGDPEPLPASCDCPCCRPAVDDLMARFARHVERSMTG